MGSGCLSLWYQHRLIGILLGPNGWLLEWLSIRSLTRSIHACIHARRLAGRPIALNPGKGTLFMGSAIPSVGVSPICEQCCPASPVRTIDFELDWCNQCCTSILSTRTISSELICFPFEVLADKCSLGLCFPFGAYQIHGIKENGQCQYSQ